MIRYAHKIIGTFIIVVILGMFLLLMHVFSSISPGWVDNERSLVPFFTWLLIGGAFAFASYVYKFVWRFILKIEPGKFYQDGYGSKFRCNKAHGDIIDITRFNLDIMDFDSSMNFEDASHYSEITDNEILKTLEKRYQMKDETERLFVRGEKE